MKREIAGIFMLASLVTVRLSWILTILCWAFAAAFLYNRQQKARS
jgi:hypothetical protein